MDKDYCPDMIQAARSVKSVHEIIELAKSGNIDLDLAQAQDIFDMLHGSNCELSDSELDNVNGGGCHYKDGRLVTTVANRCDYWICKNCGYADGHYKMMTHGMNSVPYKACPQCHEPSNCNQCKYCTYEHALWLCNNPQRHG